VPESKAGRAALRALGPERINYSCHSTKLRTIPDDLYWQPQRGSRMFSRPPRLISVGLVTPGGNRNRDAVWHPRPLQHHVHRRNVVHGAKFNGIVAVPKVNRVAHLRRPAIGRLEVQQIFRILDQHLHTREVHVHLSDK
jgi:hypothetical protein